MPNLLRCLKKTHILTHMQARNKAGGIRELASLLEGGPELSNFRQFLSALFQKEARFQTAVEKGVALPHYRDRTVLEPVVALGISKPGIGWEKGKRVHILVLIGWPDRHDEAYLRIVAEIARLLHQEAIREALQGAETPDEVLDILSGEDVPKAATS